MHSGWKEMTPISGVANCHVKGLSSIKFDDDTRMFVAQTWTPLAANFFGDVVGFHDHHRDLTLRVVRGKILNVKATRNLGLIHPFGYKPWIWDSALRGGRGSFIRDDHNHGNLVADMVTTPLTYGGYTYFVSQDCLHTVVQLTKVAAWIVTESGPSTEMPTRNWSTHDLSTWDAKEMYQPLSDEAMWKLWHSITGGS